MQNNHFSLRDILIEDGLVNDSFFEAYKNIDDAVLFTKLQHDLIFSESSLHQSIQNILGLHICTDKDLQCDDSLNSKLFQSLKKQWCLPLYETDTTIALAIYNPFILKNFTFSKPLELILTPKEFLLSKLGVSSLMNIDRIIEASYTQNASDIHFYSQENGGCDVFFRVNGALSYFQSLPNQDYTQLLQKIKLDASLDLGIYKTPQEGYLNYVTKNLNFDIRISIIPTVHLEDMVLRLFKKQTRFKTFKELSSNPTSIKLISSMCNYKNGLILVTGPTGSGKTTTLYSILRYLKLLSRGVIVSLEDPVENHIYGVRQSNVVPAKNFNYESGLKAILRQDPDIILVGEIRDKHTAKVALEAAYTGHLVLSSLHTHDVYATLLRLKSFGLDPFLTQYVLRGIIAQELVSVLCKCTQHSCTQCNSTGIKSRQLNQEILHLNQSNLSTIFDCNSLESLGEYKPWDTT